MRKIGYLTRVEGGDSIVSVLLFNNKKKSGPANRSVRVNPPKTGSGLSLHEIARGVLGDASAIGRASPVCTARKHKHNGGDCQDNDKRDDFSEQFEHNCFVLLNFLYRGEVFLPCPPRG